MNDRSYHPNRAAEWDTRQVDLYTDLLHKMAVSLGYDFDKTQIKNSWYAPQGHGTIEQELNTIRSGLAEIVTGKRFLPVVGYPPTDDEAKQNAEIRRLLIQWLRRNPDLPQTAVVATGESISTSQSRLLASGQSELPTNR